MPTYSTTFPQDITPFKKVSLTELIKILPIQLSSALNVWLTGKIISYGVTTDNLVFTTEDEPSIDFRLMFNDLVKPLGIEATVIKKINVFNDLRLYNEGRLIIDKETLTYTELPIETKKVPLLFAEQVKTLLPETIPFKFRIHITGGLVKNGWSANDADFMAGWNETSFDVIASSELILTREYFSNLLGWKVHVGQRWMPEREPIFYSLVYEKGKKCL